MDNHLMNNVPCKISEYNQNMNVMCYNYIMYLCLLFEVLSTRYVIRRQKMADPNNL